MLTPLLPWPKPLVIVEGSIGAGKSLASRELASRLGLRVLEEPVDEELLELFYADPDRWAFAFQMEMLHRRWPMQMSAASETMLGEEYGGAILDRSLWGDLVFASVLYEDGKMHKKEWEIYTKAMRNMALVLFPPTVLLYLAARPETCFERIKRRARPQEREVSLAYLQKIHDGYQRLLRTAKQGMFPWSHAVNTLVVPWDPSTATPQDWDRTAEMVREACNLAGN